jgi:hypothetical protein
MFAVSFLHVQLMPAAAAAGSWTLEDTRVAIQPAPTI